MAGTTERTCADKREEEIKKALHAKECQNEGALVDHFFFGFGEDKESMMRSNMWYLTCVPTCNASNNDHTMCCGCDEIETGCEDPGKCPNRNCGIGYAELAREYVRTSAMAYIPIKGEPIPGGVLVYDPEAMPDNQPSDCDPCADPVVGALCFRSLDDLIDEALARRTDNG